MARATQGVGFGAEAGLEMNFGDDSESDDDAVIDFGDADGGGGGGMADKDFEK